jgi:hypothetical protein
MRRLIALMCIAAVVLASTPARAQQADAVRREIDELRRQLADARQQYERTMRALSERLQRLEAAAPAAVAAPASPGGAAAPPGAAPAGGGVSALDALRPRAPFTLSGRRGAGPLLFDMGIAGDFVASLAPHDVEKAHAGTFGAQENRVFPREVELNLFGQVDPYARAYVRIEAGEDLPGEGTDVSLAEAALSLLSVPYGLQPKLGQMRVRFGLSNEIHEHDLPYIDRPNVMRNFFGDNGLVEKGVETSWLPDLPFFLEGIVGVFDGDNETAFGRGRITEPLVTTRWRTFFELGEASAVQLGVSGAHGRTEDRLDSTVLGYDVKYKYRPVGALHPWLTLASEGLYAIRRVNLVDDAGDVARRTYGRFGWYALAELQPFRRWAFGARYDSSQFPAMPGYEWAIEPYVTLLPSEFLRFRLAWKHTERDRTTIFAANDATARVVNELLLQATFILGAHPAHPF